MALSQQTQRRLPTIKKELLLGSNYDQIAAKLGVGHRTIDRDVSRWVQSGEFETWIKEEWLRLHNIIIHENPTEAYRNITKLVGKMLTQKIGVQSEHYEEIRVLWEIKEPSPSQSNTNHTQGNTNFIQHPTDSESSLVDEDGAKPKREPMKQLKEQSKAAKAQSASV